MVPSKERINTGNAYIRSFDAYICLLYASLMVVVPDCMYIYSQYKKKRKLLNEIFWGKNY